MRATSDCAITPTRTDDQVTLSVPCAVGGSVAPGCSPGAPPTRQLIAMHEAAMDRIGSIVARTRGSRRHIVVACMPKSGSTFLTAALAAATGYRRFLLNTRGYDNERDIDRAAIPMFSVLDTVSQEHMRATRSNIAWLLRMQIKPVVLVRNIFDAIVSARDHALVDAGSGPSAHVPAGFAAWSAEAQYEFIVRMGVPWLLNIVTSWQDAANELDVLWITYDEVTNRTTDTVRRILEHVGIHTAGDLEARIAGVARNAEVRFNRGVAGRGMRELTDEQIRAVHETAAPLVGRYDLSSVGLPSCTAPVRQVTV